MFQFLKSKSDNEEPKAQKTSWSSRLRGSLKKTRQKFSDNLSNLLLGKKEIDDSLFEELETILLSSDVGVETTKKILEELTDRSNRKPLADSEALLYHALDFL
jgi:fused signal recognition particle receptor